VAHRLQKGSLLRWCRRNFGGGVTFLLEAAGIARNRATRRTKGQHNLAISPAPPRSRTNRELRSTVSTGNTIPSLRTAFPGTDGEHPASQQRDTSPNECPMSVNENRITVTLQWFTDTLSRNSNFQGNTSTSTRFMQGDFAPVLLSNCGGRRRRD